MSPVDLPYLVTVAKLWLDNRYLGEGFRECQWHNDKSTLTQRSLMFRETLLQHTAWALTGSTIDVTGPSPYDLFERVRALPLLLRPACLPSDGDWLVAGSAALITIPLTQHPALGKPSFLSGRHGAPSLRCQSGDELTGASEKPHRGIFPFFNLFMLRPFLSTFLQKYPTLYSYSLTH